MRAFTKPLIVVAALFLAACTNPDFLDGRNGGADANTPGSLDDPTSVAYFQESIGDRVLFEVDQSTLTEDARLILLSQANWLRENQDYTVTIEGHADEQGTREYNLALGARRANAVVEYLVSQGVSSVRLQPVSFGKERPIEICSNESCYAQNRRSVTILNGGPAG